MFCPGNYRDSKDASQLDRFNITHIVAIHDAARKLHSISQIDHSYKSPLKATIPIIYRPKTYLCTIFLSDPPPCRIIRLSEELIQERSTFVGETETRLKCTSAMLNDSP
ncbi:Dual specificity protein phosphatase 22 [Homalodisca vitripennis]|nr:Dual specificity protein phosphatase 22 [Homalodisca vitripennis]